MDFTGSVRMLRCFRRDNFEKLLFLQEHGLAGVTERTLVLAFQCSKCRRQSVNNVHAVRRHREHRHDGWAIAHHRELQRGVSALSGRVCIRSISHKDFRDLHAPVDCGVVKQSAPASSHRVYVCTVRQQQVDDRSLPCSCRDMQRSAPENISSVRVCPFGQQQANDVFEVVRAHSAVERRVASAILRVHVRTSLEELRHHVRSSDSCDVEHGFPVHRRSELDIRPAHQRLREDVAVVEDHGGTECCPALGRHGVHVCASIQQLHSDLEAPFLDSTEQRGHSAVRCCVHASSVSKQRQHNVLLTAARSLEQRRRPVVARSVYVSTVREELPHDAYVTVTRREMEGCLPAR
ncbi:hypothetical protein PybrP1_000923 [[Pythium] brassicae (nom. inval.)]|nr:hypothetical protein PybrP1_000923 [[Pythium] brassicae (nom. inval.)]